MSPLDRRTVSRKTPLDGKLEISERAADVLARAARDGDADTLPLVADDARGRARVVSMPCTCGRAEGAHRHFFLESDLFRSLAVGSEVDVDYDEASGEVEVRTANGGSG